MILHVLPEVVTHTYHPGRGPFRNVCRLPPDEAERIISTIRAETGAFRKPDYLQRRMRTEAWLMAEKTRKLGSTRLERPVYGFLGDMTDGSDPSRPASIVVQLADLDPRMLTFTYGDSMASCPWLDGPGTVDRPLHGRVFTLPEIAEVVSRHGMPDPRLPKQRRGRDGFVEIQVWDDRLAIA